MFRFASLIREKINLTIYGTKGSVLKYLNVINLVAAFFALGTLIYFYGYPQTEASKEFLLNIVKFAFVIFIVNYLIRFFYSFKPLQFLIDTWFEGFLMLLLIYDGISLYLFNTPLLENVFKRLGVESFTPFYVLFIQFYILLIVGLEIAKFSRYISDIKIKPAATFILSFALLCFAGTGLLCLPEMTIIDGSMPFLDALFTSVSASCITGLMVVDVNTYFTFKGQLVLLILIQLGGLGIVSFASFFASFLKGGSVGMKQQSIILDFFSSDSTYNTKGILRQIVLTTLFIELVGAITMFSLWSPDIEFASLGEKIFCSIFHSVSAFCNAGISVFTGGLYNEHVRTSYILHISFMVLMVLGSIGFSTLRDLFGIEKLKMRLRYPWRQWELNTKISVYMTLGIVGVTSVLFYITESNSTLSGMKTFEGIIISVFQTVTRTCGFSTVDIEQLATPTIIMIMFLMFVGGSSGSNAGGIKTSTLFIMLLSAYTFFKGSHKLEVDKKTVSIDLLHNAFTILGYACSFVIVSIFILSLLEPDMDIVALAFEAVSAFGTTGLSMGITAELSSAGKIHILISMFAGRVTTLALFFILGSPSKQFIHKYPDAHLMIG